MFLSKYPHIQVVIHAVQRKIVVDQANAGTITLSPFNNLFASIKQEIASKLAEDQI